MSLAFRFPVRWKIMIVLLFTITATVSFITFTMARYFHADKQAYVNDWVSIAAVTTADDCSMLLRLYVQRLQSFTRVLLNENVARRDRGEMMQGFFADLPELIDITVYAEGKPVETASDKLALEQVGLGVSDLAEFREANPLPLDRILTGEVYLRNTSHSEKLPWITLAFSAEDIGGGPPVVVSTLLRPDELLRMGEQFGVFEVLIVDADGVLVAHPEETKVARRERAELDVATRAWRGSNEAGRTVEFERDGLAMLGGFASVPMGNLTVAAYIPQSTAYLASRDLLHRLLWLALLMLTLCAVAGRLWAHRVTRPVEHLLRATQAIAKGSFDIQVDIESRDEIGELAGSFNQMASELKSRDEALEEAQAQLIQSEKMAAFGQLGAGIAHEVKNPLAGILGCAQLSLITAEEGTKQHKHLTIIERETERCKAIIENLLKFARQEKTELEPTDVNAAVRDAIAIVRHQLEMSQVTLIEEIQESLPAVQANANQLQQVLMNLMINAQQAMEGKPGTVTVVTQGDGEDAVEILVRDTGPGMTKEVRRKIFEPFFTTKPTGQGTGLGLSVSFGIIRDHDGELCVESAPGEGTTFTIRLATTKGARVAVPAFA